MQYCWPRLDIYFSKQHLRVISTGKCELWNGTKLLYGSVGRQQNPYFIVLTTCNNPKIWEFIEYIYTLHAHMKKVHEYASKIAWNSQKWGLTKLEPFFYATINSLGNDIWVTYHYIQINRINKDYIFRIWYC